MGAIVPIGRLNKFTLSKILPPQIRKEVIMKKALMMSVVTLFLLAAVGNVFCEEMAKEGQISGQGFISGTWKGYPLEKGTMFLTWEQKGVLIDVPGKGPLHNMSYTCAGVQLWDKGVGSSIGYCFTLDSDGDKTMWEAEAVNIKSGPGLRTGTWKYIGGTGKYTGIEGGGEYTGHRLRPVEDGTYQSFFEIKGNYKLP